MGYTKKTLNLLKILGKTNISNKSIIEFGSQDIDVNIENLYDFIQSWNEEPLVLNDYLSNNYSRLSAKYVYMSLACKNYDCIDINKMHSSLDFDLNHNLKTKYNFSKTYDIVTNLGTSEHIFNQHSCFENLHNLCKKDGIIIISLPIQGYSNHCFFNYHPTFFKHLADANKYEILYVTYEDTSYHNENDSKNISIIFKKRNDENFVMPIQKTIDIPLEKINNLAKDKLKNSFFMLTNIDLNTINNIAIFATARAGESAYHYTKKIDKNIVCFIDDFNIGNFKDTSIPIVSYDEFISNYQTKVDLVFQGNNQQGNIYNRAGFKSRLVELSALISYDDD